MARLPDTLGARPVGSASRPVAQVSIGAAMAPGQAAADLGAMGARIAERQMDKSADLELATARSNFLRESIRAETETQQLPDYASWGDAYRQRLEAAKSEAGRSIRDNRAREMFELETGDNLVRGEARILAAARGREVDAGRASLNELIEANIEAAMETSDEASRRGLIDNASEAIDAALGRGYLTAQEAQSMRRNAVEAYAGRRLAMLSPAARLSALGRAPSGGVAAEVGAIIDAAASDPQDAQILRRFAVLESAGDPGAVNPQSGAAGLFQFMPATARQYGLADPMSAEESARAAADLLRDNRAVLSRALRREPTPQELYLAHQQGAAGAAALLRNPDMSAVDALAIAYEGNRDRARAAVVQNGGRPGMKASEFAGMWSAKFGEMQMAPAVDAALVDYLPADQVEIEADKAAKQLDAERSQAERAYLSGFQEYVQAVESGVEVSPLVAARYSDAAINGAVGDPEQRAILRGARDTALLGADITAKVRGASPEQIAERAREYAVGEVRTVGGLALAPGQAAVAEAFTKAVQADWTQRMADPAAYAISSAERVAELAENMEGADYASATLAEQARLGVPQRARRLMPKKMAEEMAASINDLPASEVGPRYAQLMQEWGPFSGQLRGELEDAGVSPDYHIAGLYADRPATTQAIASVAAMSRADIVSSLETGQAAEVRDLLSGEMETFRRAFVSGDFSGAAQRRFTALFDLAERMALEDARRTSNPSSAVKRTFARLVDEVYEVTETSDVLAYIPRMVGGKAVNMDAVEDRASDMMTRSKIKEFDPAPFGGDDDVAKARTIQAALNGVWITNDNADGLVLVVDMGDGSTLPLINASGERYEFKFVE